LSNQLHTYRAPRAPIRRSTYSAPRAPIRRRDTTTTWPDVAVISA